MTLFSLLMTLKIWRLFYNEIFLKSGSLISQENIDKIKEDEVFVENTNDIQEKDAHSYHSEEGQ